MIHIELWKNINISEWHLEKKYHSKIDSAICEVKKKYEDWCLDFLNVDRYFEADRISEFVEENKEQFDSVVVLWIWGSALWTKAIFQALKWKYYNELSREKRGWYPKLHVLDNVDPTEIQNITEILELKKTLFIVVSKSGTTIETMAQYNFFSSEIVKMGLEIKKHFVIITWENSLLNKGSLENKLEVFEIPDTIWWRFSVLTNVWLLPLAFTWIDIKKLFTWVWNIKQSLFSKDIWENKALLTALIQYHSYRELWNNITIFFPYISNLSFFSQWYKQLVWESLGKNGKWITLGCSQWVTDQHSQLQLYCEGPNDKLIIFFEWDSFWVDSKISSQDNISFWDLMKASKTGTQESINNTWKLTYTIKIKKLDEESLWALIVLFETQVAILWELLWVNAFDQPWVEAGKMITKEMLEEYKKTS